MRSSFRPFQLLDLLLTTTNCAIRRAKNRKENNDFKVMLCVYFEFLSLKTNKDCVFTRTDRYYYFINRDSTIGSQ